MLSGSDIEGLGFAIPVNSAKHVIEQLVAYGYVPGRVTISAELIDISDGMTAMIYRVRETGVYVASVVGAAQLQAGDRIESVEGKAVSSAAEVIALVEVHNVGAVSSLVVSRNGQSISVELILGERKY